MTTSQRLHGMTLEKAQTELILGGLSDYTFPFDPNARHVASFARSNQSKSWVVHILANPTVTFCYAVEDYLGAPIAYPTDAWGEKTVTRLGL